MDSSRERSLIMGGGPVTIGGGHKFQYKQNEGGKISVRDCWAGQILSAHDFRICTAPAP